uniref:Protein xmas-2-like n=1 Tax=Diabrotica virgifera virgifera TaxID=50390 RepID=A0A6P7H8J5_DIAVI
MDSKSYKIICQDYPPEFILDKNVAKQYFKQFGKFKRITFKPKARCCTVDYVNEESYLKALNNAGDYRGITFSVFKEDILPKKKETSKRTLPIWVDTGEIEAELAAMSGELPKTHRSLEGPTSPAKNVSPRLPKLKSTWQNEPKARVKTTVKSNKSMSAALSGEEIELVKLVVSQGCTFDDKYRILDARDKLMKLKLKRNPTELSSATIGTCPDMCPEKERLFREIKNQVAWYEQDDNERIMKHSKAVKQYSRSSADQEAPLAHELRPVDVLQMTMGYLLHNIIDLCDTDEIHVGDWFHFLWDRTRSIRKDITQQELCSQGAVELVEQCARFHIHCSARLVAEDPSIFDQKINTENLTKCLQTLKYMYHDLWLKGESCQNEAEFRAYVIFAEFE